MKIILRHCYSKKIEKEFINKRDMIDYINNNLNYILNDGFDEYIEFNNMSDDLEKWTVYDLVNYFFADYERI